MLIGAFGEDLNPRLEEFSPERFVIRPYDSGSFHVGLFGAGDGDDDFRVLMKLKRIRCQYEGAFIADIFDGALMFFTVDWKQDLSAADCSFNFSIITHGTIIKVIAKNLNSEYLRRENTGGMLGCSVVDYWTYTC